MNPTKDADIEQANSQHVTAPLAARIVEQDKNIADIQTELKQCRREAHNFKRKHKEETAVRLKTELPLALWRLAELASVGGASNWLTALPLDQYGFTKALFVISFACAMAGCHHSLPLTVFVDMHLPSAMPVLSHWRISIHIPYELRDITTDLLKEVCSEVTVEPSLQSLTGEVLAMRTSID